MSSPVFVDPSGRRRWVLRIVIGVAVTCVLASLTLLAIALAGGPVNRSSLLPVPEEPPAVVATTTEVPTTAEAPVPTSARTAVERMTTTTVAEPTTTTTTKTQGRRTEPPPGASNRPTAVGRG